MKFLYTFSIAGLNSDYAAQGLMAMEFWKYHNYFFSNFFVPSDDSFAFDDIIHLIPQFLSNYNPFMIKMVAFIIFILLIAIFSYIIFFCTKNLINTFSFSAILSNWVILYDFIPHESTILLIGLLLILYITKPIKNWDIIFLVVLAIGTFSDSLTLIWFTIPFIIINFSSRFREKIRSFLKFDIIFKTVVITGILVVFKKFFIDYYINHPHIFHCREWNCLINVQVPLLLTDLKFVFFYGIDINKIPVIGTIFVVFIMAFTILSIRDVISKKRIEKTDNIEKTENIEKIYWLVKFSGIVIIVTSLFYITTAIPGTSRYLLSILIGTLLIFSMVDFNKSKYSKLLLLSIILINLIFVLEVPRINTPPNDEQYKLIDFLNKSNLSFGYGDYWDANILTYLSNENVIIRAVYLDNGINPFFWWSDKRWYENIPKTFFVIVRNTNTKALYMFENIFPEPVKTIYYEDYKIYEYNTSNFSRVLNSKLLFHSGGEQLSDDNISSWFTDKNFEGYAVYGPYISLPNGRYRTTFMIKSSSDIQNVSLARLEIFDDKILKQITLNNSDIKNTREYHEFSLDFDAQNTKLLEFRVYKYPNSTLYVGNITLNKLI